jgi:CRP/FNR family cyclic AMP-dependent transcriptional regulator
MTTGVPSTNDAIISPGDANATLAGVDAAVAGEMCSPADVAAGPLAHIPLFCGLSEAEQRALFGAMSTEAFAANQTIFWRGDTGESLYIVSAGQVSVTVPNEQGDHVILEYLGPGGFFGEISLLDGGPRTATIRTTVASELYVLKRADFHSFLRQRPDVAIDILTVMGRRQRISTEALRGMKNPNIAFERTRISLWQRVSDVIATVAASSAFTLFHLVWFGGWIVLNLLATWKLLPASWAFDPFPFGLLTMVVSLEAIFLSIFVMVSQNRQAEKDRLRIDLDYQVNLKSQTEVVLLARKLERIEAHLLGDEPETR